MLLILAEDPEDASRRLMSLRSSLTDERPMRMPFRYTLVCTGRLTSTMTGPLGEIFGFHQYSPGLSWPLGFPVGVPLV